MNIYIQYIENNLKMKILPLFYVLLILVSFTNEYQYEFISEDEEDPVLQFNILGFLGGLLMKGIKTISNPNFWIEKLKTQAAKFIQKQISNQIARAHKRVNNVEEFANQVRECDRKINKDNNDKVMKIRNEVGLPNVMDFCRNNKQCGTTIKNDYDYLDIIIYKFPPLSFRDIENYMAQHPYLNMGKGIPHINRSNDPKYLADVRKVDEMMGIIKNMEANLNRCMEDPFIV